MTDLQLAREKQQSFDTWKNDNRPNLALSIDVTVLTTGNWPTYKAVDLKLPSEMMEGLDAFKVVRLSRMHLSLSYLAGWEQRLFETVDRKQVVVCPSRALLHI